MTVETFKGPLGSHRNYIAHIALPNAVDYFNLLKANREQGRCSTSDKYKELRYLLNAAESFNNVPDYLYFDTFQPRAKPSLSEFRGALHTTHPCLRVVSDIANAYKHCVRGKPNKDGQFVRNPDLLHASDLARYEIRFSVGIPVGRPLVDIQYRFDGVDGEQVLGEAFRFWVAYLDDEFQIDVRRI